PGGSCTDMTVTAGDIPGTASITAPPFGANSPTTCGLRVVVTDAAGGQTTRNWSYTLKASGSPTAVINPLPAKVLATRPAADGVVPLSGSGSTDPDTNPTQPLSYAWEQVDPTTGNPVPANAPSRGVFSNPNSVNTTWKAPSTAPYFVRFRLTVSDGA